MIPCNVRIYHMMLYSLLYNTIYRIKADILYYTMISDHMILYIYIYVRTVLPEFLCFWHIRSIVYKVMQDYYRQH